MQNMAVQTEKSLYVETKEVQVRGVHNFTLHVTETRRAWPSLTD